MRITLVYGMTPTARTIAHCRKLGLTADIVERRTGPITRDLFGFADVFAFDEAGQMLLIQATSASNRAARVRKIVETCGEVAQRWLTAGGTIEVWAWGKVKNRWQLSRLSVTAAELQRPD